MDDMLLTSDQMKMFTNGPSVRSYHTDMLWNQNWSSFDNKYLIPFIAHPVRESRESFHFYSAVSYYKCRQIVIMCGLSLLNQDENLKVSNLHSPPSFRISGGNDQVYTKKI